MRKLLIIRPEPGATETVLRATLLGLEAVARPLFAIEPVAWSSADAGDFDALLLTSANAVRHAGPLLASLATLPVVAVGDATAEAARRAGLSVSMTGAAGVQALLDTLVGSRRLLHLCGGDTTEVKTVHRVTRRTVYRAGPLPDPEFPVLAGWVVAVHSPRAGSALADLVTDRASTAIAAISGAAAEACGNGWERIEASDRPTDPALLALAARLCQSHPQ